MADLSRFFPGLGAPAAAATPPADQVRASASSKTGATLSSVSRAHSPLPCARPAYILRYECSASDAVLVLSRAQQGGSGAGAAPAAPAEQANLVVGPQIMLPAPLRTRNAMRLRASCNGMVAEPGFQHVLMVPSPRPPESAHAWQSGLLNPMALLSPTAAATPPVAGANSSDQDGQALLAMLSAPASSAPPASSPAPAGNSAPSPALAKAAKAPKGVALAPGEATYEVGAVGAAARKQTKVTAITIYNTDPGYRAGRLIAVSSRYICYGVRSGSVRVIHQTTGQRLLQKGHTSCELADLCISGEGDACTIAAVAGNGDLFVWAISIENLTEVKATELYRKDGGSHGFSRILWHPSLPLLACAASGDEATVSVLSGFAEGQVCGGDWGIGCVWVV